MDMGKLPAIGIGILVIVIILSLGSSLNNEVRETQRVLETNTVDVTNESVLNVVTGTPSNLANTAGSVQTDDYTGTIDILAIASVYNSTTLVAAGNYSLTAADTFNLTAAQYNNTNLSVTYNYSYYRPTADYTRNITTDGLNSLNETSSLIPTLIIVLILVMIIVMIKKYYD